MAVAVMLFILIHISKGTGSKRVTIREVVRTPTHQLQCSTGFDQIPRNLLANEDSPQEAALSFNLKLICLYGSKNYVFTDYNFSYKPKDLFLKESS